MTEKRGCTKMDARVQPYPQAAKKIDTTNPEVEVPTTSQKVFPIYSQGNVCGYFYANKNEIPPQKVALTNLRSSIAQSLPDSLIRPPLIKPMQVIQVPKRTMTPQILATLNTLLLSNNNTLTPAFSARNPLPPPKKVQTVSTTRIGKPLDEPKTFKPLNVVSILPAPMKIQHFIPATIQTNNIRLCVTANSNNQNKTNVIPALFSPVGCNVQKSNSQSTFLGSDNQNENTVSLACPGPLASGKRACSTGIQSSNQNCKLKKADPVCMRTAAASDSTSEKTQSEPDVNQKNNLSSLSVLAQDVKTEMPVEDKNSTSHETEQENDYGLVISSSFSLSEANASELGVAFENDS